VSCFPFRDKKNNISHAVVITSDITDRKISEELLKASRANTGTSLFNQDLELKYTWNYNPLLPALDQNIIGKTDFELFTPEYSKNLTKIKRQVINTGMPAHEHITLHVGKKEYRLDAFIQPLKNITGAITGISGSATDVTLSEKISSVMGENEKRFDAFMDNLKSGVAIYEAADNGETFIIKKFNKTALQIENFKKEDVEGKNINAVFPYVKNFGLFDVLQKVWKTGNPASMPYSFYKDDRISGWRENRVFKLPSGEIVAVYDDVSDRVIMESNLKTNEEKYRSLIENLTDSIIIIDNTGKFIFLNKVAASYFNGVPSDFEGKTVWDIFPKEIADSQMESVKKAILNGKLIVDDNRLIINGKERWFSCSLQPTRDITGKMYAVQVIARDITDLKKMQESLKRIS
jgi:PAS domain S-box-containing protein